MGRFCEFMARLYNCVDSLHHVDSAVLILSEEAVAIDL